MAKNCGDFITACLKQKLYVKNYDLQYVCVIKQMPGITNIGFSRGQQVISKK